MPFKIVRNDITKMNTEAIVNTANDQPTVGTGCDSAVYKAAGFDELLKYREEKIGFVPEGEVFITPGFNLQSKYIIHAVSPIYMGGDNGEEDKLRSCYRKSLALAKENGIKSIAFPLISTGGFGYPKEEGMRIAVDEINAFLLANEMLIYLVVFDTKATQLGEKIYPELEAYIDHNYVKGAREDEYGDAYFNSIGPSDPGYDAYLSHAQLLDRRLSRERKIRKEEADFSVGALPAMAAMPAMPIVESMAPLLDDNDIEACFDEEICESKTLAVDESWNDTIEELDKKLDERLKHRSDTYSEYLLYLIESKGMKNADVYHRAIVDKRYFSKIKNNKYFHPEKIKALCLCVGARLNLDETKDLLARAGYALSPCDLTDIIFSFYIEHKHYDVLDIDIQLEEHGLPCIIT